MDILIKLKYNGKSIQNVAPDCLQAASNVANFEEHFRCQIGNKLKIVCNTWMRWLFRKEILHAASYPLLKQIVSNVSTR